jgi:hypothetical protein
MGAVCAGVLALAIGAVLSTSPPGVPRGGTLLFDGPPASSLIPPPALAPQALRRPTAEPVARVERGAATRESQGVALTSTDVGILGAGVVGRVVPVAPIMDTPIAPGHDAVPTTDPPKPTTTTTPTTSSGGGTGGVTTGTDPPQPDPPVAPTPEPKGPVTKVIDDLGDVTGGVTGTVSGAVTGVTSTGHAEPASPSSDEQPAPAPTQVADPTATSTPVVSSVTTLVTDAVQLVATSPDGDLLG